MCGKARTMANLPAREPVALLAVSLALFEYNREKKTLQCSANVFNPRAAQFSIKSHHTGEVVTFVVDHEDMMAHEHYDGEAISYKPAWECSGVQRVFITNW